MKKTALKKSDLIENLYQRWQPLGRKNVAKATNMVFSEITKHLVSGGRLEIRNFGTIYLKPQKARDGRNPRTGEKIRVDKKYAIRFRMSRTLLERMNPHIKKSKAK
ncbi:MAG: integration host factor subunit beta [Alphaproteobacteria bacterium GM202ARS2]|nr:integration host factor subunit beta [Alphaproteobacteria bacterium GM202ARS2]